MFNRNIIFFIFIVKIFVVLRVYKLKITKSKIIKTSVKAGFLFLNNLDFNPNKFNLNPNYNLTNT